MNLNHNTNKNTGDQLTAIEWNKLAADVNELGAGGSGDSSNSIISVTDETQSEGDPTVGVTIASGVQEVGSPKVIELTKKTKGVNTTLVSGNNVNIEPRESTGKAKSTKGGNISMKPGDDIELCSHHRRFGNRDEVSLKVIDGEDNPVKLQIKASNITLSTEGKDSTKAKDEDTGLDTNAALYDDPNVMNINVTTGTGKGYLKVRALAIDLRCEENGGIALQPKGTDGSGHENKIKFEHNGGDGKEFGTFNTEKTSIFTDEYRFNKNGTVYAVTRGELETTYKVPGDPTSGVKKIDYPTQSDDFKDIITQDTPHFTWEQIFEAIDSAKRVIDVSSDSEYFNQSQQVVELIPQAVLERFPFELIGRRTLLLDDGSHLYNATVRREMVNPLNPSDGTCIYTIEAVGTDKKIQIKVYSNTPQPLSQGVTKATYCEAEIGQSFPTYNPAT